LENYIYDIKWSAHIFGTFPPFFRAGFGLNNVGLGWAWALHFGLGLFVGLGAYFVKFGQGYGVY
jgi:hypothetical protein